MRSYHEAAADLIGHIASQSPKDAIDTFQKRRERRGIVSTPISRAIKTVFKESPAKGEQFLSEILRSDLPNHTLEGIRLPDGHGALGFQLELKSLGGADSELLLRSLQLTAAGATSFTGGENRTLYAELFPKWRGKDGKAAQLYLDS